MEQTRVKEGAKKMEHAEDMRGVSKLWKGLSEAAKAPYNSKSAQEFQAQRNALMCLGLGSRGKPSKAAC